MRARASEGEGEGDGQGQGDGEGEGDGVRVRVRVAIDLPQYLPLAIGPLNGIYIGVDLGWSRSERIEPVLNGLSHAKP